MRLGEILDRDAFVARQRRKQEIDLVLLDELAHGAHGRVGGGVGGGDDEFEFLAAGGLAVFGDGCVEARYAVDAENGVGAFQRRGDADLELVGRKRRSRHQKTRERRKSERAFQHACNLPRAARSF